MTDPSPSAVSETRRPDLDTPHVVPGLAEDQAQAQAGAERERHERAERTRLEVETGSKRRQVTIEAFRAQTQRLKERLAPRPAGAAATADPNRVPAATHPDATSGTPVPHGGALPSYAALGVLGEILRVAAVIIVVVGLIGFIVALSTGSRSGLVACAFLGSGLVLGLLMYAGGMLLHAVRDMAINSWHLRIAATKSGLHVAQG